MGDWCIKTIFSNEIPQLEFLLQDSLVEGHQFVQRLVDEYRNGLNRFDREGEALFAAYSFKGIAGVCGLNRDPYSQRPEVGRVRHLYVRPDFRRRGVGGLLIRTLIATAKEHFSFLTLRTNSVAAAQFYVAQGFSAGELFPACTHYLLLNKTSRDP